MKISNFVDSIKPNLLQEYILFLYLFIYCDLLLLYAIASKEANTLFFEKTREN